MGRGIVLMTGLTAAKATVEAAKDLPAPVEGEDVEGELP